MAQTVGPDLTRDLARFYSELSYEDLSPETVDSAKYFCLDYLAMALRGAVSDSSEVMQRGVDNPERPWRGGGGRNVEKGVAPVRGSGQRVRRSQPGDGRHDQRRLHAPRSRGISRRVRLWRHDAGERSGPSSPPLRPDMI